MIKYVSASESGTTSFYISCLFDGEYSEDWDEDLLTEIIDTVFDDVDQSYSDVDMYECPDLVEEDDEEDYRPGMTIDISCDAIPDADCKKILRKLKKALGEEGYDVVDSGFETA